MTPVRRLREQVGLTQELLARGAGTTQQTISRYETGQSSPTLEKLDRLAWAVGHRMVVSFVPVAHSETAETPTTQSEPLPTRPADAPRPPHREPSNEGWTM